MHASNTRTTAQGPGRVWIRRLGFFGHVVGSVHASRVPLTRVGNAPTCDSLPPAPCSVAPFCEELPRWVWAPWP